MIIFAAFVPQIAFNPFQPPVLNKDIALAIGIRVKKL